MTAQEWKFVEESLRGFYSPVTLICDGYELYIILRRKTQMKNVIRFFVNGIIDGKWYVTDCEERRRFFRPVSEYVQSQKHRSAMKKEPKWLQKKLQNSTNAKYTYYRADWNSFSALKKHLIANNSDITLKSETKEEQDNGD